MKTLLKNCRPLCDALCGEMYSFDGCMAYLMECLGEPDAFDYLFFAGVTGDVFTPLYSRDPRRFAACLSDACPGDAPPAAMLTSALPARKPTPMRCPTVFARRSGAACPSSSARPAPTAGSFSA